MILTVEDMVMLGESGMFVIVVPAATGTVWVALPARWCGPAATSDRARVREAFAVGALMQLHALLATP